MAAEDVQDHVEVKAGPLGGPLELGDVPGPDLIGCVSGSRDSHRCGVDVDCAARHASRQNAPTSPIDPQRVVAVEGLAVPILVADLGMRRCVVASIVCGRASVDLHAGLRHDLASLADLDEADRLVGPGGLGKCVNTQKMLVSKVQVAGGMGDTASTSPSSMVASCCERRIAVCKSQSCTADGPRATARAQRCLCLNCVGARPTWRLKNLTKVVSSSMPSCAAISDTVFEVCTSQQPLGLQGNPLRDQGLGRHAGQLQRRARQALVRVAQAAGIVAHLMHAGEVGLHRVAKALEALQAAR